MPNVTALDLVNRVLVFHRFNEVSDFTRTEARAALQVINMAVDSVLNSTDWEFAKRHDGALVTWSIVTEQTPSLATMTSGTGGSGSNRVDLGYNHSDGYGTLGSAVVRFVNLDSDRGESGISYMCPMHFLSGVATSRYVLNDEWLGSNGATDDYILYAAEYVLPTTVRGMISATKQGSGTLDVRMISPEIRLEELMTEPHSHISDDTRIIHQGGAALATGDTVASGGSVSDNPNDLGLRIIIYPVPETRFKIDYSYWYLYPQLATPTDELEGVSNAAIHDVVNWAYAHSNLTGIGNDPKLGMALKADTRFEISEHRTSEKAVMSYDGRITPWGSIPRGYPGSTNPRWRWDSQTIEAP